MEGQSTTWSSVSSHELEAKERTTAELLQMQIGWDKICTDKGRIMSFAHDCNEHWAIKAQCVKTTTQN